MSETQYVCVAPAIDVRVGVDATGQGGELRRVERGGGLPIQGLHAPQIEHLLERGLIVKAEVTGGLQSAVTDAVLAAQEPPAKPGPAAKQPSKQGGS